MFISKNYPQNLNESVTIARHYGNGALEFQFKQDAQQLMHRHFQQCAQLIYLHQIPSLQTVDNRPLLFRIFYKQRLLHRLRTAFPTHHVNDIRRRRHKRSHIFAYQCVASFGIHIAHSSRKSEHIPTVVLRHFGSDYMFVVLLGTGATVFYNMISNMLRALGDSKTPLYFLVFSSVLNIFLDILFIVPFHMGVAGAAWATILSQFFSAVLSLVVGLKNFPILHLHREDFTDLKDTAILHLKTGFPMGFQMSVMCIGQLAMQAVVNSLGTAAVAGYTAASKADQLSVLVNNAMMTAISNYVAQNFGAGRWDRIRQGVRACLIQTEAFNLIMCIGILLLRHPIVRMFLSDPTKEIYHYSDMYLTIVAPFYFVLGLLAVYRTSIQSMQNGKAPFAACMIELVMRIAATVGLSGIIGYTSVCIASPMAWIGACALLIPVYYKMMKGNCAALLRME